MSIRVQTADIDERTQHTAVDALACKYSACTKGYFNDPLLLPLFERLKRPIGEVKKPPIINRGYFARIESIQELIRSFFSLTADIPIQIVLLGCGFDTIALNLNSYSTGDLSIFEIDFPAIIAKKVAVLSSMETGKGSSCESIAEDGDDEELDDERDEGKVDTDTTSDTSSKFVEIPHGFVRGSISYLVRFGFSSHHSSRMCPLIKCTSPPA